MFKNLLRKISYAALTCSAICGLSSVNLAYGDIDTGSITVTGTISDTCSNVSAATTNLNLGNLSDSVATSATNALSITCTASTTYWLSIGATSSTDTSFNILNGLVTIPVAVTDNDNVLTIGSSAVTHTANGSAETITLKFATAGTDVTGKTAGSYSGSTTVFVNF